MRIYLMINTIICIIYYVFILCKATNKFWDSYDDTRSILVDLLLSTFLLILFGLPVSICCYAYGLYIRFTKKELPQSFLNIERLFKK